MPSPPAFFDSHAHLDGGAYSPDLDETLARARAAGVTHIICIGASEGVASNHRTLALVDRHDGLYATVGIHPHDAALADEGVLAEISRLASHPKVVGIGETGLDHHYGLSEPAHQEFAFRSFLRLAKDRDLACVVHTREAEADTMRILKEEQADRMRGVLHCFTGTRRLALDAVELGWFISFSGVLTFKNAQELREIARELPKDRVLVETDCPYLAPVPLRGRRNEPAFVVHTAQALAELWGEDPASVREQTAKNAARLFGIDLTQCSQPDEQTSRPDEQAARPDEHVSRPDDQGLKADA